MLMNSRVANKTLLFIVNFSLKICKRVQKWRREPILWVQQLSTVCLSLCLSIFTFLYYILYYFKTKPQGICFFHPKVDSVIFRRTFRTFFFNHFNLRTATDKSGAHLLFTFLWKCWGQMVHHCWRRNLKT